MARTSTPMTPAQWEKQLRKFKVPYRVIGDFADPQSGRDHETGLFFGPVYGGVQHHTGSDSSDLINRELIDKGRPDLPGPLSQAGLADDGFIELFTAGRANHAGGGDPDVLRAVMRQDYGDYPPHTDKHQGEAGAVDGNDAFYGLEAYYWKILTKAQYKSIVGFWAAVCDFHGWTAKAIIGHKEWSDWKPDPNLIDMADLRRDIQERIDAQGDLEPKGPTFVTKKITEAIRANIAYDKAVRKITNPKINTAALRADIKAQRRTLREHERKN